MHDLPLLLLCSLLALAPTVLRFARSHWPFWVRLLGHAVLLVLLTIFASRLFGSPLHPHFLPSLEGPVRRLWQQLIEAGWWLLVARFAIVLGRFFVVLENRPRETQIVSDLVAAAIVIVAALAIVNFAFEVPIRGLLATSGIIAIVLGLALQSTLSDVFSGIAVGLERPYKVGDLVWIEGGVEGRIIQVTWRATHVSTGDGNVAVVPNSIVARARIINRSAPDPSRRETIGLSLSSLAVPEHVLTTLAAATRACSLIAARPAPAFSCVGLRGDGAGYEVSFSTADSDGLAAARTELYTSIHRHLRHAGIPLAVGGMPGQAEGVPRAVDVLAQSELFGVLGERQRERIAATAHPMTFEEGQALITQGEPAEALHFLVRGVVEVSVTSTGASGNLVSEVVHRMAPGESLGAIGLITGGTYGATAVALTGVQTYRLDRADILAAIRSEPLLDQALDAVAKRAMILIKRDPAMHDDVPLDRPEQIHHRLGRLLRALGA